MRLAHQSLGKIILIEFCTQQDEYLWHKRENFKVTSCHDRIKKRFSLWLKFDELSRLIRWPDIKSRYSFECIQMEFHRCNNLFHNCTCVVGFAKEKINIVWWITAFQSYSELCKEKKRFVLKVRALRALQKIFYDFENCWIT